MGGKAAREVLLCMCIGSLSLEANLEGTHFLSRDRVSSLSSNIQLCATCGPVDLEVYAMYLCDVSGSRDYSLCLLSLSTADYTYCTYTVYYPLLYIILYICWIGTYCTYSIFLSADAIDGLIC